MLDLKEIYEYIYYLQWRMISSIVSNVCINLFNFEYNKEEYCNIENNAKNTKK